MKTFVLSLLVCSLSMTVIALLFRLVCRALGTRYAARWRYAAWLVVLAGFLLPIRSAWPSSPVSLPAAPAGEPRRPLLFPPPRASTPIPCSFWFGCWAADLCWPACWFGMSHSVERRRGSAARWRGRTPAWPGRFSPPGKTLPSRSGGVAACPALWRSACSGPVSCFPTVPTLRRSCPWCSSMSWSTFQRKDLLFQTLLAFCRCLHWFNPLLPLIQRMMERDCELACDEMVLRSASPTPGTGIAICCWIPPRRKWSAPRCCPRASAAGRPP